MGLHCGICSGRTMTVCCAELGICTWCCYVAAVVGTATSTFMFGAVLSRGLVQLHPVTTVLCCFPVAGRLGRSVQCKRQKCIWSVVAILQEEQHCQRCLWSCCRYCWVSHHHGIHHCSSVCPLPAHCTACQRSSISRTFMTEHMVRPGFSCWCVACNLNSMS
jgi:hypothetical protein